MDEGEFIRRNRQALGLTLRQFGEMCGFTASYIGIIERNKKRPSIDTYNQILGQFGYELTIVRKE